MKAEIKSTLTYLIGFGGTLTAAYLISSGDLRNGAFLLIVSVILAFLFGHDVPAK